MKKIYYSLLITAAAVLGSLSTHAQTDLSIGNIDAGFEYNQQTGVIKDIYFTVLSNENGSASNVKIAMYFVPVGATSMDDALLLETTTMPSISGNAARDVTDWTINVNEVENVPPDGEYRLLVYVDYDKSISETDETNNSLFISTQGNNLTFTKSGPPTGVAEVNTNIADFTTWPNPAVADIKISFSVKNTTSGSVKLMDITGKEVMTAMPANTTFAAGKHETPLSLVNLDAGVYYIVLQTTEGTSTHKMIKY